MFFDKSYKLNWVSNRLEIKGNQTDLDRLKKKMGKEFTAPYTYNVKRDFFTFKSKHFSNPIFAFWNLQLFTEQTWINEVASRIAHGDAWDDFNCAWWGVPTDVAAPDYEGSTTVLESDTPNKLVYKFRTTSGYRDSTMFDTPIRAIGELSLQHPNLDIKLMYRSSDWNQTAILSWPIVE